MTTTRADSELDSVAEQGDGHGSGFTAWSACEARRMLTHPAYALTALGLVLVWVLRNLIWAGDPFPVLTNMSWGVQLPMLVLVGGAFFAAHFNAVGSYRFGTVEWELTHPLPRWQQMCGQFVATLAPALVAGVLAMVSLLWAGMRDAAVGEILVGEVVSVSAVVLLGGVLGVVAAHVGKSLGAGFLVFAVLAVVAVAGVLATGRPWRWLTLVATENPFDTPAAPVAAVMRPAWWHVSWLVSLAVVLAVVTLMIAGMPRRRGVVVVVVAAAVAVSCAVQQLSAPGLLATPAWQQAGLHPVGQQVCRQLEQTTYCAFPDFVSRVPAWHAVVVAQLDAVPPATATATGPFYVRQALALPGSDGYGYPIPQGWQSEDLDAGTPDPVSVSTRWVGSDSSSFDQTQVLAFALGFAHRLVTGKTADPPDGGGGMVGLCGGPGVLTLWLATGTSEQGGSALREVQAHGDLIGVPVADSATTLAGGFREAAVLGELLRLDRGTVTGRVMKNWSLLADADTTVDQAAQALGVRAGGEVPEGSALCS